MGTFALALVAALFGYRYSLDKLQSFEELRHVVNADTNTALGKWLAESLPKDAVIVARDIGEIGYLSGLPIVDMTGLTDRSIARKRGNLLDRELNLDDIFGKNPSAFVFVSKLPGPVGGPRRFSAYSSTQSTIALLDDPRMNKQFTFTHDIRHTNACGKPTTSTGNRFRTEKAVRATQRIPTSSKYIYAKTLRIRCESNARFQRIVLHPAHVFARRDRHRFRSERPRRRRDLARAGLSVLVLEAEDARRRGAHARGDAARFHHDLGAAFFPFGQTSPALAPLDLAGAGLVWKHAPIDSAHPAADGTCAVDQPRPRDERCELRRGRPGVAQDRALAPPHAGSDARRAAVDAARGRADAALRPLNLLRLARVALSSGRGYA